MMVRAAPRTLADAPPSVRRYLALLGGRADSDIQELRSLLSINARFVFAGTVYQGVPAILDRLATMPARSGVDRWPWAVAPGATDRMLTLRAPAPRGTPNGLSAMEYRFELDEAGLIALIAPIPHHSTPPDLRPALVPGDAAEDFTLADMAGTEVGLRQTGAGAYLVIWTCNHCPWALAWHARLQSVINDYAGRGVRAVQLNANDPNVSPHDALALSRERVAAGLFASPYLQDTGQRVARVWGARHTPDVFVLTSALQVAYHGAPDADHQDEAQNAQWIRAALDDVLAGRAVAAPLTHPVGCTIKWTL